MTRFDVLDAILRRFAVDREWVALEDAWRDGRIGSKACLEGQLRSVRISKAALERYLSTVPLDPHFKRLLAWLKRQGVEPVIVSDNFSCIVERILRRHHAQGARVYANELTFAEDRLIPTFPYADTRCPRGCAHCKRQHLVAAGKRTQAVIYVGDGLSDRCPAEQADLVFAKGPLLRYLRRNGSACVAFRHLGDVHDYLKGFGR